MCMQSKPLRESEEAHRVTPKASLLNRFANWGAAQIALPVTARIISEESVKLLVLLFPLIQANVGFEKSRERALHKLIFLKAGVCSWSFSRRTFFACCFQVDKTIILTFFRTGTVSLFPERRRRKLHWHFEKRIQRHWCRPMRWIRAKVLVP